MMALGIRAIAVGSGIDSVPPKGSSDSEVIAYAKKTNQVIVTYNHDLILLCDEAAQPFVWVDPRGEQLSRFEQVIVAMQQIERWDALLRSDPGVCVRALRTKCSPITSGEAARLAEQRMRELARRKRTKTLTASALGPLVAD